MYSEASILSLMQSVGFGEPTNELVGVTVDEVHRTGTLGRTFQGFHKLVTLENLYATADIVAMNTEAFNKFINGLKKDSAIKALNKILDQHKSYQDSFDYSGTIITKLPLFSEVYGYQLAFDAIELMMVTKRENIEARNAKLAYGALKMELEGAINDKGGVISKGLERRLLEVIKNVNNILFPDNLTISDATNNW